MEKKPQKVLNKKIENSKDSLSIFNIEENKLKQASIIFFYHFFIRFSLNLFNLFVCFTLIN